MSLRLIPSDKPQVYSRRSQGVKHGLGSARWAFHLSLCALAGAVVGGCARPAPLVRDAGFLIGIRYPVEPLRRRAGGGLEQRVDRDFERLAGLGFDTVLVSHLADEDREPVTRSARRNRLDLILPDREIVYYVRTGHIDGEYGSLDALVSARAGGTLYAPPVAMLYVGVAAGRASSSRAADVAQRLNRVRPGLRGMATIAPSCEASASGTDGLIPLRRGVPLDSGATPTDAGPAARRADSVALVSISQPVGEADAASARWLRGFHAGLAAGCMGGLILDSYVEVPGRFEGLLDDRGLLLISRSAAVKKVIMRARHWGPMLHGLTAVGMIDAQTVDRDLCAVLFARGQRRLVMVWNRSPKRFVHSRLSFSGTLAGRQAARAVEVPGDSSTVGGEVILAQDGRIEVRADLAPGDAALYEIF